MLMTTPYFQVALNRDLEQDAARREKAMQSCTSCCRRGRRSRSSRTDRIF